MFKISEKCSVGAAVIIYRELAALLQAMSECCQQPERQISRLRRVAWCSFEKLILAEVSNWLSDHQMTPPPVHLSMSGLSREFDEIVRSLTTKEQIELALLQHQSLMFMCQQMNQIFKAKPKLVTSDLSSARRQLQKWCSQSGQEYRQLRNAALPVEVESPAVSRTKRVRSGYMVPTGAW